MRQPHASATSLVSAQPASTPTSSPTPTTPRPIRPRAKTTTTDLGNIPTSLIYSTTSAILSHSAKPWTTVTYEDIYFGTIEVFDGLDTSLPYPSTTTPTPASVKSIVSKSSKSAAAAAAAAAKASLESATLSLLASLSSAYVAAAATPSETATTASYYPRPMASGPISVAPGSTSPVLNLAACRTATDLDGCIVSAESALLLTGGQGVSSTSGIFSEGTPTTVTMPYLGAVVAKGKATFVVGGEESGGGRSRWRVELGLGLWLGFVVIGGWLFVLVL
ncbi:hypothetical protein OEA41_001540 [Lepraria neglecta]|uniref:Uncharacterized protein n=1 Tax=Lepraria neglecta TaxID=209136 RepID=A0AAD9ZAY7_9LECA|nr:hypothetical protein OEA41_001540 [Lepraria neglecta]